MFERKYYQQAKQVTSSRDGVVTYRDVEKDKEWDYPAYQMAFLKGSEHVSFSISEGFVFVVEPFYDQYIVVGGIRR